MTARTLVDGKQERMVARMCNYSNEPFELRANYCLARAEPVEYIPRSGEKPRGEWCIDKGDVNVLSVSTGAVETTDSPPTAGRDPVEISSTTTVGASTTAAGADMPVVDATTATDVPPPMDQPTTDDSSSHIQCLIDGLPDDLTDEQRARAAAFIRSRSDVFSRSEYNIGRT